MELVTGRPQDKRIDKEERVYDLLDQLNIDYQRIDHEKADTMGICLEKKMHYYAPYKGQLSEKDFIEFYNSPKTFFQKDITQENIYK